MLKEFKEFSMKGNMIDLAVGVIIGAAFGSVMTSLVSDMLMPLLGLLTGGVDFSSKMMVLKEGATAGPYATPAAAAEAGAVTLNWGMFLNAIIAFLLISFAIFLVIKAINKMRKQKEVEADTKPCPQCKMVVPIDAVKCGHCTSQL
ncbi:MAG: large conductance mechanosensitive channel protein MscL [Armatimonadota bacterium]|nr:large conductance mechanosensitive channel protein MscL [Armatimonadota bacterium]